jgi:hypothetical protein
VSITAADVLDSARLTLIDSAQTTWSQAELIGYLNEALRATSAAKADFYTIRENIEMDAGALQELPAGGVSLIDIFENAYSGIPVTLVDKELLDECNRFLAPEDRERDVQHFTADPRDPRRFVVTPPNDGTGEVRSVFGAVHPEIATADDDLLVNGIYQPVLIDYVLHRAYAKNSKRQDLTKSGYHKQQWGQALGLKSQSQAAIAPKVAVSEGKE